MQNLNKREKVPYKIGIVLICMDHQGHVVPVMFNDPFISEV